MNEILFGDCREIMRRWAEQGVKAQMCVTSPPYFGLRDFTKRALRKRFASLDDFLKRRNATASATRPSTPSSTPTPPCTG